MFFRRRNAKRPAMTLEGVLGPNNRLDTAEGMAVEAPNAVCVTARGDLLYSSGNRVMLLDRWGGEPRQWCVLEAPVSALCAGPGGRVAIATTGPELTVREGTGLPVDGWRLPPGLKAITDCRFVSADEIAVVDNGYATQEDVLAVAPWDDASRGSAWAVSRQGAPQPLARDLHCPMSIADGPEGEQVVSLLERASVVTLSGKVLQSGYPAYLGRLRRTAHGYVLACLSRRDPLIEFLKTEKAFVAEMKATIAPRHWISPRARPEFNHDFPIELGASRLYGEVKPWAPSFSYGLVIELDDALMPVASAHSRANGRRHEITDVVAWGDFLIAVSRASGELLRFSPTGRA